MIKTNNGFFMFDSKNIAIKLNILKNFRGLLNGAQRSFEGIDTIDKCVLIWSPSTKSLHIHHSSNLRTLVHKPAKVGLCDFVKFLKTK